MALRTTPSVEGAAERTRAISASAIYTVGMVTGAAAWAFAVSVIGGLASPQAVLAITAAIGGLYGALGLIGQQPPLPQRSWQVPQSWFQSIGIWAFAPAGFTLGVGVLTPIRYASFIVWTGLLAALHPPIAVGVGAVYGLSRTVSNWRGSFGTPSIGVSDPERLGRQRATYLRIANVSMLLVALGIAVSWTADALAFRPSGPIRAPSVEVAGLADSAGGQCSLNAVRPKIGKLVQSFNNGNGGRLRAFVSSDVLFRPYKGARINSIERFVRNQHSRGVSWSVLSLDGPNGRQRVRATFSLALRVRQRGAAVSEGFVDLGVSCRSGRVVRWSGNVAAPPGKVNAPAVSQDFAVQGTDPGLVARCKPDLIETQLRQMLEAFNRGLGWTFESNFQPADRFDAYNGSRHLGHRYPVGIVPFVRARWSAGDGWTALALRLPTAAGGSDGVFSLRLQVTQHGNVVSESGTKIAIACQSGKIIHWVGPLVGP